PMLFFSSRRRHTIFDCDWSSNVCSSDLTFKVKSVEMQPLDKASLDQLNPAAKPEPDKTDVQLPDDKKSFDQLLQEVHASNALPRSEERRVGKECSATRCPSRVRTKK